MHPGKTQIILGISLHSAVKECLCPHSYPLSTAETLIRLGYSESLLGAQVIVFFFFFFFFLWFGLNNYFLIMSAYISVYIAVKTMSNQPEAMFKQQNCCAV